MTTKVLLAAAAIAGLAGTHAHAARYYLTAGGSLYTAEFGGTVQSGSLGLGAGQRSPAIAFDSMGQLWASVNTGASGDLYKVNGFAANAFAPSVTFVSDLTSQSNSFDFKGTGANERLIGTRNRVAGDGGSGMVYFESTTNAYTAFSSTFAANGAFGNGSLPSTGYDAVNDVYYGVTAGASDNNRRIVTIDGTSGLISATGLSMVFDGVDDQGDAGYGNIQLAGGDIVGGEYYISFWSNALDLAVIGTLDLTTGAFTELTTLDVGGTQPISMGLAVIIPAPLASSAACAGLLLLGARRRRA